MTAITITLET